MRNQVPTPVKILSGFNIKRLHLGIGSEYFGTKNLITRKIKNIDRCHFFL